MIAESRSVMDHFQPQISLVAYQHMHNTSYLNSFKPVLTSHYKRRWTSAGSWEQSSPSTSWTVTVVVMKLHVIMLSAGVCFGGKERLHFIPDTAKVNAKLYVETFYWNLFKIADLFCYLASSFSRTERLHTRQRWLKTGLLPTAVNSLVKVNGLRTRLISTLWTTMSGELCSNATSHFNPSRKTSMSSRKFCSWYGTSCHRTRSTKPYWACRKDCGLVWKLVVDTSNIR